MKYHKKEKMYCLSKEDVDDLFREGIELFFDSELNNYYWWLEIVEETEPDFFEVDENDWFRVINLGYDGENDIRDIMDWMEFKYKISYTRQHYQGVMISGNNDNLWESYIIIDHVQLSSFISISVANIDERSKYILMKKVLNTMFGFFERKDGKIYGPTTTIFNRMIEGKTKWI